MNPAEAALRPILRLHIRRLVIDPGLGALRPDAFAAALETALAERLSPAAEAPAVGVADRVADRVWSRVQDCLPDAPSTALSRRSTRA